MLAFQPQCAPLMLGPLPHRDQAAAWNLVLHALPAFPVLPIFEAHNETLADLGAAGIPMRNNNEVGGAVIDRDAWERSMPKLDAAFLRGASDGWAATLGALAGLAQHEAILRRSRAVCGALMGPIGLALLLVDDEAVPIAHDRMLLSALAQHVFLRRRWLRKELLRANERALVWVYEPWAAVLDDPFAPAPADTLCLALDQALGDEQPRVVWAGDARAARQVLAALPVDAIGLPLPPPEHAEAWAPLVRRSVQQRGGIGWGVVPIEPNAVQHTSVGRLAAQFGDWLRALEGHGIAPDDVVAASWIMPHDALAYVDEATAHRVLTLTTLVASVLRQEHGVE